MTPFQPSRTYGFVRSRQLEGTYPGSPRTGVWPITSLRIQRGWGCPPEGAWPHVPSQDGWPPSEPPDMDAQAENFRIGWYQRVCSLAECKRFIASGQSVLATLDVWDKWAEAPKGRIPQRSETDVPRGTHAVTLEGYSDVIGEFRFANCWGADWGDRGYGYIGYELLESIWQEGWSFTSPIDTKAPLGARPTLSEWAVEEPSGGILHCRELLDGDIRIGWAFAVVRNKVVHIEELFVKPQFRGKGYGAKLIRRFAKLAAEHNCDFRIWISCADLAKENLKVIDRIAHSLGLGLIPSGMRWAPVAAVPGFNTSPSIYDLPQYDPPAAIAPDTWKSVGELLTGGIAVAASNLLYQVIRSRVDSKNGRRIRVKSGDFELETTQLSEEQFLTLLGTIREAESKHQIKSKLLESGFTEKP
jgi:GNAT superfamily N-acetyltransferase